MRVGIIIKHGRWRAAARVVAAMPANQELVTQGAQASTAPQCMHLMTMMIGLLPATGCCTTRACPGCICLGITGLHAAACNVAPATVMRSTREHMRQPHPAQQIPCFASLAALQVTSLTQVP